MTKSLLEEVEADLNREKNEQALGQLSEIWYGNPFTIGKRVLIIGFVIIAILFAVTGHIITAALFGLFDLAIVAAIACTNKGLEVNKRP